MSRYIDYDSEPVKRRSEARHLVRCMEIVIIYAAVLWVLGNIALTIKGGAELAQTVSITSESAVYVEGECRTCEAGLP